MNRGYIVFVPAVWHGYAASMCRYTEAEAVERFDSFVAGPMPLAMAESVARELNAIVYAQDFPTTKQAKLYALVGIMRDRAMQTAEPVPRALLLQSADALKAEAGKPDDDDDEKGAA